MAGSFNSSVLDAPDTAVRRIMMKREAGQPLTQRETTRYAERANAEAQTTREGGTVKGSITPRRLSAREQGQKMRADDDAFAAGYEGKPDPTETRPAGGPPSPANYPGMSTSEQTSAMRAGGGGVNVNSYSGSMWTKPGSYTEARPPGESPAVAREKMADGILRRKFGAPANEQPGAAATPTNETRADDVLRRRFGPPPNERGAVDVAPGAVARRPAAAPVRPAAAEPSSGPIGNVRKLTPEEIAANKKRGGYSKSPLTLPPI